MKLTPQQKRRKLKIDLKELKWRSNSSEFNIIKVHENIYKIAIKSGDLIIDYYSSTERWISRCENIHCVGRDNLISFLSFLNKSKDKCVSGSTKRETNKTEVGLMKDLYSELYSETFKKLLDVESDFIYVAVCANQLLRAIEMEDEDSIKASASTLRKALTTHFDTMMEARNERDKHLLKGVFGVGE